MAKQNQVAVQMREILDDYTVELVRATNAAEHKMAKEAVNKLRNTSPKRKTKGGGKYAKSWRVRTDRGSGGIDTVTVHNKDHYQLTHLLENGHVVKNKKGTYGRTSPQKHIGPVNDWACDELPREIERELK